MTNAAPAISKRTLASTNTRKACETPFKFELLEDDGTGSGIIAHVIGGQAKTVVEKTAELVNERRRQEAIRASEASANRPGDAITPFEDDVAFGQRLSAVRLIGWDGLEEDCTPANALELCQNNPGYAAQITTQSNKITNFTKASPKA